MYKVRVDVIAVHKLSESKFKIWVEGMRNINMNVVYKLKKKRRRVELNRVGEKELKIESVDCLKFIALEFLFSTQTMNKRKD